MPTFPEGATDRERERLDELWAAEQKVIGRLQTFIMAGHVGEAKQALADAEKHEREHQREAEELRRVGKKPGAPLQRALAEAADWVAEARTALDKVLAAKQEIIDEREDAKAKRHALRVRVHQRRHPPRERDAA